MAVARPIPLEAPVIRIVLVMLSRRCNDRKLWTLVHSQVLIGAFASAVGSTKDTVRFYTRLGLLQAQPCSAGQRHYATYDETQRERFIFIEQCKALGFTLAEIKAALDERNAGLHTTLRQQEWLKGKLRNLEERIQALRQAEARLRSKLQTYEGAPLRSLPMRGSRG
jgi:MerR family Zn(II)-responsive transcriptional regulator of zntA